MRSIKRLYREPFRPINNPTPKVREAYSRLGTTLAAGGYTGFVIVAATEQASFEVFTKLALLLGIGVIMTVVAVYVLKGADHV